jgi:hypothetical protein
MAQITRVADGEKQANRLLESVAIVNQTAASTAVTKAVTVPSWATTACFLLNITVVGGTTPKLDFKLSGVDPWTLDTTHIWNLGDWDGITQITAAASPVLVAIDVGPAVAADDTGSATASCRYGVNASLPPVIAYTYTTQDAADDADYTFTISVFFRA